MLVSAIGCFSRNQFIPQFGGIYKNGDCTWRVYDCEELVGKLTGDDVVGFRSYSLKETSLRSVVIGEVTSLKEDPLSVDLTIFPLCPTATKVLFPKVTP